MSAIVRQWLDGLEERQDVVYVILATEADVLTSKTFVRTNIENPEHLEKFLCDSVDAMTRPRTWLGRALTWLMRAWSL